MEAVLSRNGGNLIEKNLISLVREYNSNDISGNLRRKIRKLNDRLFSGEDPPEVQMMLRIILWSKKKMLEEQKGSRPSTPASSDDEDEEQY